MPMPWLAPPSICPATDSGLIAKPASCAIAKPSSVISPVSGSTSTSAACAVKPGAIFRVGDRAACRRRPGSSAPKFVVHLPRRREVNVLLLGAVTRIVAVGHLEFFRRHLEALGGDLEHLPLASSAASLTARPTVYVVLLPALMPAKGRSACRR